MRRVAATIAVLSVSGAVLADPPAGSVPSRATALVDALRDGRSPAARAEAARALTRARTMDGGPSAEALWDALAAGIGDPDPALRVAAIDAMAAYGDARRLEGDAGAVSLGRLLAAAADPAAARVRRAALLALHALLGLEGRPEVERAFATALADPDGGVRSVAARGLAGVARLARLRDRWAAERDPRTAEALEAEDRVLDTAGPRLAAMLSDPDPDTRRYAAYGVLEAGGSPADVLPVVVESMRGAHGPSLIAPLSVLAEMGPAAEAATPDVVAALGEDTSVRWLSAGEEALDAMRAIGPSARAALPALERALLDARPAVRTAAAAALPTLDGDAPSCARAVAVALEREADPRVRGALLEAVGAIGVSGAWIDRLEAGLAGAESERRGALAGLARLGARAGAARPTLERLVREGGVSQELAAWALGLVGGPADAARALGVVADRERRGDLEAALERVGPPDAALVPELAAALPHAPAEVATALGRIGSAAGDAAPALEALLSARGPRVRIAAAQALLALGTRTEAARALLLAELHAGAARADEASLAAYALGRAGTADEETLAVLRAAYDPWSDAAPAIAFALARLSGDPRPWVEAILDGVARRHPSPDPRVLDALGDLGPEAAAAVPALEHQALVWTRGEGPRRGHVAPTRAAIRALGRIGPAARETLPTLRMLRRNVLFRDAATEAIARIESR